MNSINRVQLQGQLIADPVLRYSPEGKATARAQILTWRPPDDPQGSAKADTHSVVLFGSEAELLGRNFRKGGWVRFRAQLCSRSWTDKRQREHTSTEIVASSFEIGFAEQFERPSAKPVPAAASIGVGQAPIEDLESDIWF